MRKEDENKGNELWRLILLGVVTIIYIAVICFYIDPVFCRALNSTFNSCDKPKNTNSYNTTKKAPSDTIVVKMSIQ